MKTTETHEDHHSDIYRKSEAILERGALYRVSCTTVTRLVVLCTRCPRDAQGSRLCQNQRKESSDHAKWHFDLFLTENEKKMTSDAVLRWPGDKSTLMLSRVWRHKRRFPENLPVSGRTCGGLSASLHVSGSYSAMS